MAASKGFRILPTTNSYSFTAPSYQQSSKKSTSADVDEGPALLKYNGKDSRFKDEKDLKVGLLEIPPCNDSKNLIVRVCMAVSKVYGCVGKIKQLTIFVHSRILQQIFKLTRSHVNYPCRTTSLVSVVKSSF